MKGGMNHGDDSDPIDCKMTKEGYIWFVAYSTIPNGHVLFMGYLGLCYAMTIMLLVGRILTWPHPEATSVIIPLTQMGICIVLLFTTNSEKTSPSQEARIIRNLCIAASCLATGTALAFEQPIVVLEKSLALALMKNVPLEFAGLAVWAEIQRRSRLEWEAFVKSVEDSCEDDWLADSEME